MLVPAPLASYLLPGILGEVEPLYNSRFGMDGDEGGDVWEYAHGAGGAARLEHVPRRLPP
eukprot:4043662-Alexandrium_andersonii.AAC.1